MSNVVLTIGGRDYTMTCAAGEEAHIGELGQMIDDKLKSLPETTSHNDSRALVFAALLLADELYELRKSSAATPPTGLALAASLPGENPEVSPERLNALAERLEALANALGMAA